MVSVALPVVVPRHMAIAMDGNGRWASKRFMPRIAGHKQGVEVLKKLVRACAQRHIAVLTVFALSGLMDILALALSREVSQLQRDGVQLRFLGARDGLSERVKKGLLDAEAVTAGNSTLILNVCFNFGGRWDIATAAARLASEGVPITESSMTGALSLSHCADPDLVIRTGGEKRLSSFLLWQAAYSELYFSDLLWPDFDEAALDSALLEFASRERRFGKTSSQLAVESQV
jgi:undecaprenyl diphosphate synthase